MEEKRHVPAVNEDSDENEDEEEKCGIYGWKYPSLQCMANVQWFTLFYSLAGMMTQTLTLYVNSQVPNLEKQFGLSSAESGLLMSFNDIGFLICCLFISSLANFVHIPRFLFYCILLYGISGIICSIPHYISQAFENLHTIGNEPHKKTVLYNKTENYTMNDMPLCVPEMQLGKDNSTICDDKRNEIFKIASTEFKTVAIVIIALGMIVQGIGKAPRSPFVTVYIDNNVEKSKTGFFVGIMGAATIFGPALSYSLGGYLSKIYVTLEEVNMTPEDPRFIGAWWLGFLIFGIGSLIVAIPIFMFPRKFKWTKKKKMEFKREMQKEKLLLTKKAKIKDRVSSYWRVLRNPIYVSVLITNCCMVMGDNGHISFLSKYLQTQFGTPLWKANLILAATKLVALAIGAFLGGYLTRRIPMIPQNTFGLLLSLCIVQNVIFAFCFFLGCDQPKVVGPQSNHGYAAIPLSNCSTSCGCDEDKFFPVCGSDGINYHSPCYGGCMESLEGGSKYSNCTCIGNGGVARAGSCEPGCNNLIPWALATFVSSLSSCTKMMLSFIAKIRCVEDRDKSTAIGLVAFLLSLLAFMPAPIIFGKIVDTTCLIWMTGCNKGGACLWYNIVDFRIRFHLITQFFFMVATFSVLYAFVKIRKWKTWRPEGRRDEKT